MLEVSCTALRWAGTQHCRLPPPRDVVGSTTSLLAHSQEHSWEMLLPEQATVFGRLVPESPHDWLDCLWREHCHLCAACQQQSAAAT